MLTREEIIECYMINEKHVIAELLFDTITKYETKLEELQKQLSSSSLQLKTCENCKHCFKDKFGTTCSNENINIVNAYGSNEQDVYLSVSADFSCNKFEPKEKE